MNDGEIISSLRQICREQGAEIEKKKLQIEDVEEENRLLRIRIRELEEAIDEQVKQKEELGRWSSHLQSIIDSDVKRQEAQESRIKELHIWCEHLQKIVDESGKLQDWCTHLQSIVDEDARQREEREQQYRRLEQRYGVFFRLARRFIQHL